MFLMRILPGVLKELLKHVPTVLFEAIEWSELASEVPKMGRQILNKEGYQPLFDSQKEFLTPLDIHLTDIDLKHKELVIDKLVTEKWVQLYFAQLFSPHGVFLDLRSQYFSSEGQVLKWHPPGLWHKFSEQFRLGMIKIYDGFYLGNEQLFHQGLIDIGLSQESWPQADRQKLADLFKEQFGASVTEEIRLNLESFNQSLIKITDFLLEKKVKINIDFLYLGIYLVFFYSAVEKSSEKIDVKKLYLDVSTRLKKQY